MFNLVLHDLRVCGSLQIVYKLESPVSYAFRSPHELHRMPRRVQCIPHRDQCMLHRAHTQNNPKNRLYDAFHPSFHGNFLKNKNRLPMESSNRNISLPHGRIYLKRIIHFVHSWAGKCRSQTLHIVATNKYNSPYNLHKIDAICEWFVRLLDGSVVQIKNCLKPYDVNK